MCDLLRTSAHSRIVPNNPPRHRLWPLSGTQDDLRSPFGKRIDSNLSDLPRSPLSPIHPPRAAGLNLAAKLASRSAIPPTGEFMVSAWRIDRVTWEIVPPTDQEIGDCPERHSFKHNVHCALPLGVVLARSAGHLFQTDPLPGNARICPQMSAHKWKCGERTQTHLPFSPS